VKMIGDKVEAEDILMETFYKAFVSISSYSFDYAFSTWIYTIAKNNTIDYIRNAKKNVLHNCKSDVLSDKSRNFIDDLAEDNKKEPDNIVINREEKEVIRNYISLLKPHYRILIEKFYFEEKKYDEIAEELKLPIGTVKGKLHRARKIINNFLRQNT
ncbi:MAG TPA: sigma-70 family RNA polymerase sigma factor, partial [Bacteroidales bacterium]|nr:sigma-70 family RNA polymerase sigma factor [Bacteroidales bacterium]